MLFASDLDRTLIYSEQFVEKDQVAVKAVEHGSYTSYMTIRAIQMVQQVARQILFVPCTTRTVAQYQRIQFFQNEVTFKYAVVSNGGNLLVDGEIDHGYRQNLVKEVQQNCLSADDLINEFKKITDNSWLKQIKKADNLFFYSIIERKKIPFDELQYFKNWATEQNWKVSVQGRKLYLVPRVVNKWAAIKEVLNRVGERAVFAAGDSVLDLPMLDGASHALCPQHGELYDHYRQTGHNTLRADSSRTNENYYHGNLNFPIQQDKTKMTLCFTKTPGITAAEEILAAVITWIDLGTAQPRGR